MLRVMYMMKKGSQHTIKASITVSIIFVALSSFLSLLLLLLLMFMDIRSFDKYRLVLLLGSAIESLSNLTFCGLVSCDFVVLYQDLCHA